jgi:hypothetical protein
MWLSGKPDGTYFPLSGQNVNCENPRRKPVLHSRVPDWGCWGGFRTENGSVSCNSWLVLGVRSRQDDDGLLFDRPPATGRWALFFLCPPQARSLLHSLYTGDWRFALAGSRGLGAKSDGTVSEGSN